MNKNVVRVVAGMILLAAPMAWVSRGLSGREKPLKNASFIPPWFPQAQFAGYYAALDKGLYRKRGIDLEILPGGANRSSVDFLETKRADFATLWLSTAIQKRDQGLDLVNIGQVIQKSALMFVAKASSGIATPQDMNGRKVGLWRGDFDLQPEAFFKKYGLKVKVIVQPFSPNYIHMFLMDAVDVATVMWYNEYHLILNYGLDPDELKTFFFDDHGLNVPEDGIYVLKETLDKDPELCRSFVEASFEGWRFAFSYPDETLDIILKYMAAAHVPANRVHQKWMLERMKDLIRLPSESESCGMLSFEDYSKGARMLKDSGLIKNIPPYDTFYRKMK
jgi:NitT/TauT family transport system substrate-binding protein